MNTPTREDLLGFVLGALEAQEHQRVADCVNTHPDLQLELQRIKAQIAPLEWCRQPTAGFPVGLARRTCEIVARESRQAACPPSAGSPSGTPQPESLRKSDSPGDASNKRRRALKSAALVCFAAILGAALGPVALRFTPAFANSPTANRAFATNRPELPTSATIAPGRFTSAAVEVDPSVFSASFISLGGPPSEPTFIANSIPLGRSVGRWNDWRPLAGDSSAENRGDDFCAPNRIGQRLFSRSVFNDQFRPDVQLISN